MANTANFLRRQSSRDMHQTTTAKTLDNLELKVGGENFACKCGKRVAVYVTKCGYRFFFVDVNPRFMPYSAFYFCKR